MARQHSSVEDVVESLEHGSLSPSMPPVPARGERWWGHHVRELRWQAELARLSVDPIFLGHGVVRGDGAPVLLIPGFLAGDASLLVMRNWLARMGYRPHRSMIAVNVACSDRAADRLERQLEQIATGARRPVVLIGHSRGGHFAKALGHRRPDVVAAVISLGAGLDAPFDISIPTRWAVGAFRALYAQTSDRVAGNGCLSDTCRCRFARDYSAPFPGAVPLTSVYSRGDGVVRWRACVVPYARCVEVSGSHIGLAFNRKVYRVLGDTLAQQAPRRPVMH